MSKLRKFAVTEGETCKILTFGSLLKQLQQMSELELSEPVWANSENKRWVVTGVWDDCDIPVITLTPVKIAKKLNLRYE